MKEDSATGSKPGTNSDMPERVHCENEPPISSEELGKYSKTKTKVDAVDLTQPGASILSLNLQLEQAAISEESTQPTIALIKEPPLHKVPPFFEIRRSQKGGYGAFALQDIEPYTIILEERALLEASNVDFIEKFEGLSLEEQVDFMSLACFDRIHPDKRISTFKTNR